ncbi:hypothetical protein FACS1894180_4920 [Bacteroidia bacterium]|nr:hypothetical protein FACS1894180_4920 [Bacteroidia bacterium]
MKKKTVIIMTNLHSFFGKIYDPRLKGRSQYLLIDILILGVMAVLCGAESWENMPFTVEQIWYF